MDSPAGIRSSAASTPDITITEQEVRNEELRLPSTALEPHRNLTFHLPDSPKKPTVDVQPLLIIPKGVVDFVDDEGVCKIPRSARPASLREGDCTPSPVALRQRPKMLSELKRSISTSHLGHLFHPRDVGNTGNGAQGGKSSSASQSGSGSPLPKSADVQELFNKHNKNICPDLEAVSRALTALRAQSRPGDNEYVTSLTRLATSLELSRADSKKALIQAMQARDTGRNEVCRSLCLSIVQNSHADIDTRVYSYNILSTMASPGQAMNYLSEAFKLVEENHEAHPECEKLLGVIALLKDGAIEKDGGCFNEEAVEANQKLCELSMPPTTPREFSYPRASSGSLEVPKADIPSGMLTPKTKKILSWARNSSPTKPKQNV